ncbi:hypothetical protein QZH41_009531, partial [Actinostola sp. cb2023]
PFECCKVIEFVFFFQDSMDLSVSGKVSVRPIHPSILHKQFCFQVMSPNEVKYFSCRSADELNKWINSIKKSIQPTRDKQHRTDVGMTVWVLDAKGLAIKPKKKYRKLDHLESFSYEWEVQTRYYCEILLDKNLYSRTTAKTKAESLFWGESFVFEDLPDFVKLTVNIYKDNESKNKKGKRKIIGKVDVIVENLDNNQETERWFPVTLTTGKSPNGETPSIRLKIKYQRVCILPIKAYSEILSYIKDHYMLLCETLESAVSSKVKDEIAGVILRVLEPIGKAQEFLVDIVMNEVNKLADENLIFRGNSFATKAMDTYMKMVGESYLQETLGNFIVSVYNTNEDCEVDPPKSTTGNLESKRDNLKSFVEKAWLNIVNSSNYFPRDLQETFHRFQQRCANRNKDLSNNLISSSIFLRFLCPAILSPSLFHLVQEYPNEKTSRTLTLIAKVIQNLANFTRFGGKEEYMGFMNEFVENNFEQMKHFLERISAHCETREKHFDAGIDHGRELSVLYQTLKEQMNKLDQDSKDNLGRLQFVLDSLDEAYKEFEDISTSENHSTPPRKWASSSDLINDQKKDNITLTPVQAHRTTKRKQDSPTTGRQSPEWQTTPRRPPRVLPTPQHLIVAPEDIIVASPYDLENRRFSSAILSLTHEEDDLSSTTSSSHLRRHSYLNAVNDEKTPSSSRRVTEGNTRLQKKVRNFKSGYQNSSTKTGSDVESYDSFSSEETARNTTDPSRYLADTPGKISRQRPWSLAIDTPSQCYQYSPKQARPVTPPVITDRSRTLPVGTNSPRTLRKASPLAIIDSITRGPTERDSDHSSPASSPLPQRRILQQSPSSTAGSTAGSRTEDDYREDKLPSRTKLNEENNNQGLVRELEDTKRTLASTHEQLILQESSTHNLVASFKERLAETEENLKKLRNDRESEVKDLLDRLVSVENELAKEREDMQEMLQAKQLIINAQEKRIKSLDSTNARLVTTLNQMKSRDKMKQNKLEIEERTDEYV